MRNVVLALVALVPLSAQACEGTFRGSVTQSFGSTIQDGDIELIARSGQVSGYIMGHMQKIKRPVSGGVTQDCKLVNVILEGTSGKYALDGTVESGMGRSTGADPFRLSWTAKRVD